jgi:hypothetical protein
MNITIIGRIGEKAFFETIETYRSNIPEQILTTQKNNRMKFEAIGYNPKDVVFESLNN